MRRRDCSDCRHLKAYVTLWCGNEEAIKFRGTSIPGIYNCKFWKISLRKELISKFRKWIRRVNN